MNEKRIRMAVDKIYSHFLTAATFDAYVEEDQAALTRLDDGRESYTAAEYKEGISAADELGSAATMFLMHNEMAEMIFEYEFGEHIAHASGYNFWSDVWEPAFALAKTGRDEEAKEYIANFVKEKLAEIVC